MIREILKKLHERAEYANRRMVEECRAGDDDAARYWVTYRDGVNAAIRDAEVIALEMGHG